jgi:hypothetical protein
VRGYGTFLSFLQHFVFLTQLAMAKELVEMMDNANVRMVYLEKIAQVNFQSA